MTDEFYNNEFGYIVLALCLLSPVAVLLVIGWWKGDLGELLRQGREARRRRRG